MKLIPKGEEQVWLVQALKNHCDQRGWQRFVLEPILAPTPEFFPEASGETGQLLDRTAHRLLTYAGLGDVDVELEITHVDGPLEDGDWPIWMASFSHPKLVVGVRADFTPDAEDLAGAMSHMVAEVFRQRHRLTMVDAEEEALQTEVTSVFLGFGILAANSALRYQSGGDIDGDWVVSAWQITSFGGLSPQALTYLLALQCTVRGLDKRQLAGVRGFLETNQAAFFDEALTLFAGKAELLRESLGIPPYETWTVTPIASELPELRPYDASKTRFVGFEETAPPEEVSEPVRGYPTFRVRRLKPYPVWGAILAAIVTVISITVIETSLTPGIFFAALLGGATLGLIYALSHPYDICSDPKCETVIPEGDFTCPGCDRHIKGRIKSPSYRLDAEERILEDGEDWVEIG